MALSVGVAALLGIAPMILVLLLSGVTVLRTSRLHAQA
jgi:hypothetical protein